jgi:hypothetical protein
MRRKDGNAAGGAILDARLSYDCLKEKLSTSIQNITTILENIVMLLI